MKATRHGQYLVQLTRFGPIFPVSCYLVREEDGFTLVDTNVVGSGRAILAAASGAGGSIRRILLTHAHVDHVGSLDQLHEALPEAEVLITARDARFLRGDKSLDPDEPQVKPRGGYPKRETAPSRTIADGDRVGSLRVVAAPGHTPGQAALFDDRERTLIAGDAFQTQGGVAVSGVLKWRFPLPAFATWHKPTALRSARALRGLEPARLAVGHGPVVEAPMAAMDAAIAEAARKFGGEE